MERILRTLAEFVPLGITGGVLAVIFAFGWFWIRRGEEQDRARRSLGAVLGVSFALVALIAILMAAPMSDSARGQLLGFVGILLSAAIALSSTTLLGNLLAGLALRTSRAFRIGDFLRVDDHFGRVSELAWSHLELQTEDGDLTTLPNLYVATHPHTVVRASGTILSATLSLGYDVPRDLVEEHLLAAAAVCELEKPFVHVMELGDFAVTYRVAGLLRDVRQMLTYRSRLRGAILDALHGAGIEIVSPTFMNTRAFEKDERFLARPSPSRRPRSGAAAEEVMFNKAEGASALEELRERQAQTSARLGELEGRLKGAQEAERAGLDAERAALQGELDGLAAQIEAATRALESDQDGV